MKSFVFSLALTALVLLNGFSSLLHSQSWYQPTSTVFVEPGGESREHVIDIEHVTINIRVDGPEGKVQGTVSGIVHSLREKVDSIDFDGVRMTVHSARLNGKPLRFVVFDSSVRVYPQPGLVYDGTDTISFDYECHPRRGMHFTGWSDSTNRARKQVWTQGEDSDNRNWCILDDYPNDKMITETIITFDSSYQVLSNGNLLGTTLNSDGTKTWHYTMTKPHVTYLIMVAIGKFAIEERHSASGLPVHLYYYPERPECVQPTYRYATEAIDFMEKQLNVPFPWESYSQVPVQDYIFGAMENTTATVFGDFSLCDAREALDRNYIGTDVHELTHQWFGDFITERDWKDIWLHESFATFYPKLFSRKVYGEPTYEWMRRGEQNQALGAGERDRLPVVSSLSGTARRYPKGSAVLDMLRYVVGENNFDHAITYYLKHHAYSLVHTDEFYLAFQDALGMSLDWFFDEWLYRGNEPNYTVRYQDVMDMKSGERSTEFQVEQTQVADALSPYFRMPVVFEVHYKDGSMNTVREEVSKQAQTVRVPNPQKKDIAYTLFDPGSYILKRVNFKKSFEELREQAMNAPHMIDRYDAVHQMHEDSTFDEQKTDEFLQSIYTKESFQAVKSEIVAHMLRSKTTIATDLVKTAIGDNDVEVRKAVVSGTKRIPEKLRESYERMLADSSYWIIENVFTKLCENFPSRKAEYLKKLENVHGPSQRVHIACLECRAADNDRAALDTLVDYCSHSFEFQTRQNAMAAVKRLNYCNEALVGYLVEAMLSTNNRLADVARGLAEGWMQQRRYSELFVKYYRAHQWKKWQQDILAKLVGETPGRRRR